MAALLHVHSTPDAGFPVLDELRAEGLNVIDSSPEAEDVARSAGNDVVAALISPTVDAPVMVARAIHRANPEAHILFLTTDVNEPVLRRDLLLAPRIGTHWSVTRPETAEAAIRTAVGAAARRREVRDTLGRMNVRLADPAAAPRRAILSEQFLASILNQISDGVIAVDRDHVVITYNAAAGRMFGDDLRVGSTFVVADGETTRNQITLELRSTEVTDEAGRRQGHAIVARDITARRRADERRTFLAGAATKLAATLEVEVMLQTLAQIVAERVGGICAVDLVEGDVISRAALAAEDEKFSLAAKLRKFPPATDGDHPSVTAIRDGAAVVRNDMDVDAMREFARSEQHVTLLERLGIRSFASVPLRAGKRTIGALTFGRGRAFSSEEIEECEELAGNAAAALQNAWIYHAAEEANRAKDEFLATLSHELRTPMTSILGWIQMLRIGDLETQMADEAMQAIEQSARVQAQLIDDLLDLSRIQMGKLHLQLEDVDLSAVVRAAAETVWPAAHARQIALDVVIAPEIPLVAGDPNRLQQVVWNLLSNAVKFTSKGGRVAVKLDVDESQARIVVSDNGRGIEHDFLPHVFERFRQADSSVTRRFGGLGLGLSIVRQIVELHGGTVTAASEGPERGSTFTVRLPITALRSSSPAELPGAQKLADLTGARILVVDDDPGAARVVSAVLTHAGAEVEIRQSVPEALDAIRARLPDVLISDIAMPGQDGFELISHVRNVLRINPDRLPAIALTALGDMQNRVRILGAGFQRFVRKPVDAHHLTEVTARLVRR